MTVPLRNAMTTVPAVRAELVRRLRDQVLVEPDDPTVTYGDPGRHIPGRFVAVMAVDGEITRDVRRLPHNPHNSVDEDYSLKLVVWSLAKNVNDQAAQQRLVEDAFATAERIDLHLRANQDAWTLGGLVTWCLLNRMTHEDFTLEEGRAAQVELYLNVRASRV